MRTFVTTDNPEAATMVRDVLTRRGYDCPSAHVASLDRAVDRVFQARPDCLVVLLSPDIERAIATILETRSITKTRMVAVGPASDPQLILRVLREGAAEYVDESLIESDLPAALQRLKIISAAPAQSGKIIVVLGPSGGSGASTVAANVAAVLAKHKGRCAAIDLKLEHGDLETLLDAAPIHTLADFCQNLDRMDQAMFERCFVRLDSGVHLLAPPRAYSDIHLVTLKGIRKCLTMAREAFPYVVVDVDHSYREEQVAALYQAETILLVFRLDFVSMRNVRRTLDFLSQAGIELSRVRLVANRYRQPRELSVKQVEEVLGTKVSHFVPDEPKSVLPANNRGIPVVLDRPRAKVSRSIETLAMSVNGRVDPHSS